MIRGAIHERANKTKDCEYNSTFLFKSLALLTILDIPLGNETTYPRDKKLVKGIKFKGNL
jgi:hypothetical protein